jgi:hypothetical protein
MRAQRVWMEVDTSHHIEIEQLHLQLADLNRTISELEKAHPEREAIEHLKTNAVALARRIDDVRCSVATDKLVGLLTK